MMALIIVGCAVAFIGLILAALGVIVARMQDKGRHVAGRYVDTSRSLAEINGTPPIIPMGQHHAGMPRRKPLVNRQPWQTAQMPAITEPEPLPPARPYVGYACCEHCYTDNAPCLRPDSHPVPCSDGCNGCNAPVYGQVPVAEVLEAERLAGVMIP